MFDELIKIGDLKKILESKFGEDWFYLEPETIEYEFRTNGIEVSKLLNDKICLLICLYSNPYLIYENSLFFIHAVEVINNNIAEFDHFPFPTSLELAWAIKELEELLEINLENVNSVSAIVHYMLRHEGFKHPTKFFDKFLDVNVEHLEPNKEKAIEMYLDGMNNGISS